MNENGNIENLCQISEIALRRMRYPDLANFCYREVWVNDSQSSLEGISFRYSTIALIGLLAARQQKKLTHWSDPELETIQQHLFNNRLSEKDLGDWGLLLWMLSDGLANLSEVVYDELSERLLGSRGQLGLSKWGSMELSFLLAGIVAHLEKMPFENRNRELADTVYRSLALTYSPAAGLFFGIPLKSEWKKRIRRNINSFASQVYPIYALARYYRLFAFTDALLMAETCANKIIENQTPNGGWCWQYNVHNGKAIEPYPLYSVHQDGMAPMALLLLDQVSSRSYRPVVEQGMEWLHGKNELNQNMVDYSKPTIWRAIRRKGSQMVNVSLALNSMLSIAGINANLKMPTAFSLVKECRPYHLGWLLLAWS